MGNGGRTAFPITFSNMNYCFVLTGKDRNTTTATDGGMSYTRETVSTVMIWSGVSAGIAISWIAIGC